jgi:site-specific recombinase XerD
MFTSPRSGGSGGSERPASPLISAPLDAERIDARRIEAFAKHLRTKKGGGRRGGKPLSPESIQNYLGTLSALLNFAVRKKWLPASPMTAVDLRAMSTDAPLDELTFLEPGEVAGLVEAAVEGSITRSTWPST